MYADPTGGTGPLFMTAMIAFIVFMVVVAIGLIAFFRSKKWL